MQRTGRKESFYVPRPNSHGSASPSTVRALSINNDQINSNGSLKARPRNSVRNEIVALMFETMIKTVVKSWKTIEIKESPEVKIALTRTMSDSEEKRKTTRTCYNGNCIK